MNFKGKDCVSHVPKRLAGMDERMDNSCKRRAEYLHRSLIILHTQCSQWQAAFIREKSVSSLKLVWEPRLLGGEPGYETRGEGIWSKG